MVLRVGLALIYFFSFLHAQQDLDTTIPDSEEENGLEEQQIRWEESRMESIDINRLAQVGAYELQWADSTVWNSIVKHREHTGPYISVYEIQTLPEIDSVTFQRLYPLLKVSSNPGTFWKQRKDTDLHYILFRNASIASLQTWQTRYARSLKDAYALRINARYRHGLLRLSGTVQFRPHESWHCVVGHYKLNWGQGLVLGNFFPGKRANPISSVYNSQPFWIAWNGSGAHARGIAAEHHRKQLIFRSWLSHTKDPATVRNDTLRYWQWMAQPNAALVQENMVGAGLVHRSLHTEYGFALFGKQTALPNLLWNGRRFLICGSMYAKLQAAQQSLAAELAWSGGKTSLLVAGISPLNKTTDVSYVFRYSQAGAESRHRYAFGFSSSTQKTNLIAFYFSAQKTFRMFQWALHGEFLSEQEPDEVQESRKAELGSTLVWKWSRKHSMNLKFFGEKWPAFPTQTRWHWQWQQQIESGLFRIKTRMQSTQARTGLAWVAGGDVDLKFPSWVLMMGVSFYQVPHYASKQSWYERTFYLQNGFVWYHGEGLNRYVMLTWKLKKVNKISLRWHVEEQNQRLQHIIALQWIIQCKDGFTK
ncbi:MAG: hypothetical protein MUF42_10290 [Cytophagaceae bacterium]|jgi:hypothetical protein|nr:hypothetical protein [Cytophagaceae bacterium]